jgi:hypothetical protein
MFKAAYLQDANKVSDQCWRKTFIVFDVREYGNRWIAAKSD